MVVVGRATCLSGVCEWEGPHMYSVHIHTRVELVAPGSLTESSAKVI